jgi:soluble lytic murein transglycosylase-like protein
MRLCHLILFGAAAAFAGESVVLSNGFRLRADRHEVEDDRVRLYSGAGITELDADAVAAFEVDAPAETGEPEKPRAAAAAEPRDRIAAAAERHGLPEKLVRSVAWAESGFRADAVSPKGAIGVMQLMPATARALRADPYDPEQNIEAGVRYLRDLLIRYNGSVSQALAAYNAGPGAVARYGGVPPYRETQNYVNRVLRDYTRHGPAISTSGERALSLPSLSTAETE